MNLGERPLPHYFSVLEGTESPYYLASKNISIPLDLSASNLNLWDAHRSAVSSLLISSFPGVANNRFDVPDLPPLPPSQDDSSPDGARSSPPPPDAPSSNYPSLMELKAELGNRMMQECQLCEHRCKVNRLQKEKGVCGVLEPRLSSEFIHMGEEPELVPSHTLFFAGCNLRCVYCQNYDISQNPHSGAKVTVDQVVRIMAHRHALNINWVGGDPTPNLSFILDVLKTSTIPRAQVWNSNMYLTPEAMQLLDGVMDLYLTDFKYGNNRCGKELSGVENYFEVISRNHEMLRGRDTIIRHLVLPGHLECCTQPILEWIRENRPDAVVNVMSQYRPAHKAHRFPGLNRRLRSEEYRKAVGLARELGLRLTN